METINCQICNSSKNKEYIKVKDRFNISNDNFIIVKCGCGFVFLNPRPGKSEIGKFYNSKDYQPHSSTSIFYKIAQNYSFKWKFSLIKNLVTNKSKILDYGSGDGTFSKYLKSKNFTVDTYEPILNDMVSTVGTQKYDLITLWHSLEHIHDLNDDIQIIKKHLKENGKILIAVPNINSIDAKIFKHKWVAYDAPRHLYHFNSKTIKALLFNHNISIKSKIPVIQDTFFNILLSLNTSNFFVKMFKFLFLSFYSFITIKFNNKYSSSNIYICTIK